MTMTRSMPTTSAQRAISSSWPWSVQNGAGGLSGGPLEHLAQPRVEVADRAGLDVLLPHGRHHAAQRAKRDRDVHPLAAEVVDDPADHVGLRPGEELAADHPARLRAPRWPPSRGLASGGSAAACRPRTATTGRSPNGRRSTDFETARCGARPARAALAARATARPGAPSCPSCAARCGRAATPRARAATARWRAIRPRTGQLRLPSILRLVLPGYRRSRPRRRRSERHAPACARAAPAQPPSVGGIAVRPRAPRTKIGTRSSSRSRVSTLMSDVVPCLARREQDAHGHRCGDLRWRRHVGRRRVAFGRLGNAGEGLEVADDADAGAGDVVDHLAGDASGRGHRPGRQLDGRPAPGPAPCASWRASPRSA